VIIHFRQGRSLVHNVNYELSRWLVHIARRSVALTARRSVALIARRSLALIGRLSLAHTSPANDREVGAWAVPGSLRRLSFHHRVFRAVAHRLSFPRAAEELLIGRLAVSHYVHGLEQELGMQLLAQMQT
jgi:Bacterial regulatory helix-turn-helix protein, lysR family